MSLTCSPTTINQTIHQTQLTCYHWLLRSGKGYASLPVILSDMLRQLEHRRCVMLLFFCFEQSLRQLRLFVMVCKAGGVGKLEEIGGGGADVADMVIIIYIFR